jgi:hypothetical protein
MIENWCRQVKTPHNYTLNPPYVCKIRGLIKHGKILLVP